MTEKTTPKQVMYIAGIRQRFDSELAARRYMAELKERGIAYTYWHAAVGEHYVTIKNGAK